MRPTSIKQLRRVGTEGRVLSLVVAALVPLAVAGCATKGYVDDQIARATQPLEATDAQTKQELARVEDVATSAQRESEEARRASEDARTIAIQGVEYEVVSDHVLYFAYDSAELDEVALASLANVENLLRQDPAYRVELIGCADPKGSERYNEELGFRRAQAVLRELRDRLGQSLDRYSLVSYGEQTPALEVEGDLFTTDEHSRVVLVRLLRPQPMNQLTDVSFNGR